MASSYDENVGDTHPDSQPPLLTGSTSTFVGFADTTWDRDGFAFDLNALFAGDPSGHYLHVTLSTLGDAFSGLDMQWAIVQRNTWDQTAPITQDDQYVTNPNSLFGGIFNLGSNTGQPPPGSGPVANLTETIEIPLILNLLDSDSTQDDDPILIIDILSAGVFINNFSSMVRLDYRVDVEVGGGVNPIKTWTGFGTRAEKFDVHTATSPVIINAFEGEDFVWAGQRNDTAYGGNSRDIVIGDNGNDVLYGDTGANSAGAPDQLLGGGGNDICYGAAGNDYINGEWGNDKLYGGAANDLIYGGFGADVIAGGDGSDRLWGGSSPTPQGSWFGGPVVVQWNGTTGTAISPEAWTIAGEAQSTDASRDVISGGAGNDFLYGQGGNDLLIGGLGRDVMFGGQGSDVFDFNAVAETGKTPATRDVIRDFTHLVDDIDLSTIDAKVGVLGNQAFSFIGQGAFKGVKGQLHYRFEGPAKTIVEGDLNGDKKADFQIELTGHKLLTAGDFIL